MKLSLGARHAELWTDETMGWLQVFNGDERRDIALAVEPLTCGLDAFNSGPTEADAIVLQPGESFSVAGESSAVNPLVMRSRQVGQPVDGWLAPGTIVTSHYCRHPAVDVENLAVDEV